jgi:arsenate reductase
MLARRGRVVAASTVAGVRLSHRAAPTAHGSSRRRLLGSFTIYHDVKCGESRAALAVLEDADVAYTKVNCLKQPPQASALRKVASVLQGGAEALLKDNSWPRMVNPDEIAACCAGNPELMQVPVLVAPCGGSAVTRPLAASDAELRAWVTQHADGARNQAKVVNSAPADGSGGGSGGLAGGDEPPADAAELGEELQALLDMVDQMQEHDLLVTADELGVNPADLPLTQDLPALRGVVHKAMRKQFEGLL